MDIKEMMYYIMNKPYFKITVLSNNRKVKTFCQLASGKGKGEDFFIISKELKCAWFKPQTPIIDGLKFITYVNLDNAIPLKIKTETKYTDNALTIKQEKILKISEDEDKQKIQYKDGKPVEFVEISFPPTILFQKVEALFVKEILAQPPSKWEEMKWVFIALILVGGFILWQAMGSLRGLM